MESADQPGGFESVSFLDADHYADLIEQGGLAAALRCLSQELGIDVGDIRPDSEWPPAAFKTARMASSRGPMRVLLGLGRRWFAVTFDNVDADLVWASGGTDDLREVVAVLGAWRRGDTLRELGNSFPFMKYSRLSEGYERGTPVETQWEIILDDPRGSVRRDLLLRLHADDRLRRMFPSFSHETLRLAKDHSDRSAGEVLIDARSDGTYAIWSSVDDRVRSVTGLEELATTVASMLHQL